MFKSSLDQTVTQFENTLQRLVEVANKSIDIVENKYFKEEFDANRLFRLEDIGVAGATGTITLTNRIGQRGIITKAICSIQPIAAVTGVLTIGRFSDPIQSIQTRPLILAPLDYEVGPADIIRMTWAGATDTVAPYFCVSGYYVGSRWG